MMKVAIRALFTRVVELGGTLSGEHGIGLVQKEFMDVACSDRALDLMKAIKLARPQGHLEPREDLPWVGCLNLTWVKSGALECAVPLG